MPRLSVNEENLLDLLTTKLYSTDPELTIRELLQNASDAIVEVAGNDKHSINVEVDSVGTDRWISVTDTGIGMDESDLRDRLAVIADGDKLKRAEKLGTGKIAGQFGIGFLSTLIIADRVEVLTKKKSDTRTWRFLLERTGEYKIEEAAESRDRGTKVVLHLGDNRDRNRELLDKISDLMTEQGMANAIREWGYLLRFPVFLKARGSGSRQHVNARSMPWEDDQSTKTAFEDLYPGETPPIFSFRFEQEQGAVKYGGAFFFQEGVLYEPGVRLYSRGLLVDPQNAQLIPDYAPFLQGVVECSQINIDLARRNPEHDAAYRELKSELSKQFTAAFLKFAQLRPDDMAKLWAATDNTVTSRLLRLVDSSSESMGARREAAIDFLLKTCQDIPFQILDEISGGQGRPVWKTIRELVGAKRSGVDAHYGSQDVIDVLYTGSRVPVEKDILITEHRELIDVGREGKSHDDLIRAIGRYNDEIREMHKFQVVPAILPPADSVSDEEQRELWGPTLSLIYTSVNFYKREHEVTVEKIRPEDTPIIVGIEDIDDDEVAGLREALAQVGMSGPAMAGIISKLDQVLNSVGGSRIRIRVNADNATMRLLARAALKDTTVRDAEIALRTITWRAVLDYFGIGATRDMISQERTNVNLVVTTLLNRAERLSEALAKESDLRNKLQDLEAISPRQTEPGAPTRCIIGIVDIADSTRRIFGLSAAGPEQKARTLNSLVSHIATAVGSFADVTSFTGDGVQFVIREGLSIDAARQAGAKLLDLSRSVRSLVTADSDLNSFFEEYGDGAPKLRTALDSGDVYKGQIAGVNESFGLPFIRATRIVSNKEAFQKAKSQLLLTKWAHNNATGKLGIFQAGDFQSATIVSIAGVEPSEIECFAPITD